MYKPFSPSLYNLWHVQYRVDAVHLDDVVLETIGEVLGGRVDETIHTQ